MRTFRIDHPTGFIELYTDKFFPCEQSKARKIFRLVKKYCDYEQRKDLLQLLIDRESGLKCEEAEDERSAKALQRQIDQIQNNQLTFVKMIVK